MLEKKISNKKCVYLGIEVVLVLQLGLSKQESLLRSIPQSYI